MTQALPVGSRQKCDKSCLIKKFRTWGVRGRLSSPGSIVKSILKNTPPPNKGKCKETVAFLIATLGRERRVTEAQPFKGMVHYGGRKGGLLGLSHLRVWSTMEAGEQSR